MAKLKQNIIISPHASGNGGPLNRCKAPKARKQLGLPDARGQVRPPSRIGAVKTGHGADTKKVGTVCGRGLDAARTDVGCADIGAAFARTDSFLATVRGRKNLF